MSCVTSLPHDDTLGCIEGGSRTGVTRVGMTEYDEVYIPGGEQNICGIRVRT